MPKSNFGVMPFRNYGPGYQDSAEAIAQNELLRRLLPEQGPPMPSMDEESRAGLSSFLGGLQMTAPKDKQKDVGLGFSPELRASYARLRRELRERPEPTAEEEAQFQSQQGLSTRLNRLLDLLRYYGSAAPSPVSDPFAGRYAPQMASQFYNPTIMDQQAQLYAANPAAQNMMNFALAPQAITRNPEFGFTGATPSSGGFLSRTGARR
jgi:hypothetical protein